MAVDHFDCCIVGAGVVGLACARALAMRGYSTLVLETTKTYGAGISSRNSEVIHAGIYYPTNSLKAQLCVEGKHLLYEYCDRKGIPHRRLGKLIVATSHDQVEQLAALESRAMDNGVLDLEWIDSKRLSTMEPQVRAQLALLSPSTGIIDSHALMTSLLLDLEAERGTLCLNTEFLSAQQTNTGFRVEVRSVGEPYAFHCGHFVNAAGLQAQAVAARIEGSSRHSIPALHLCKGCYFSLSGQSPFAHLIYPLPDPNTIGLGIHATVDLSGQARFGPDTEYVETENYLIPDDRKAHFITAIQHYFPAVDANKLAPAYAGIRPKIQAPGESARDFIIQNHSNGLINLFGIESPGLTAAMAIAERVTQLICN
ncbi:MAG: FAD-dependent oxidoreductase [Pseudomonadales bacterium]|nr:FAD-dependent oxidoreductase [Pseudomonadales bacterium]